MISSRTTRAAPGGAAAPLVVAATVAALAAALLWPAMLNGGPLIFFDSLGYLDQGRSGVEMVAGRVAEALAPAAEGADGAGGGGLQAAAREASFLRSVVYPAFIYLGSLGPLGFTGAALLQSAVVVALVAVIAGREARARPAAAAAAAAVCVALTSAPWTVSTLMPDVFAAVAILCAMIVAARLDRLGLLGKLFVFGAATLAALSHYGHPPLYLAASGAALLALLAQRRLSLAAVALTVGPLAVAAAASLGVAQAVFDEPSVAPRRMPLLLARSMEDGPALWHLEAHCGDYGYAVCELWPDGEIPSDLGTLLWSDDGLLKRATDEQMNRIRQEEFLILKRALMDYPLAQTWSFVGNAVRQMGMIGMGDASWGRVIDGGDGRFRREGEGPRDIAGLGAVELAQKAVVLGALGLILFRIARDGLRAGDRERALLFVAVAGLAANAAIFGGLSAPVDRYQARVIWIVPMLAAAFWLARRGAGDAPGRPNG
jgi:hypothetical protein